MLKTIVQQILETKILKSVDWFARKKHVMPAISNG
jgi:hypothetical protein